MLDGDLLAQVRETELRGAVGGVLRGDDRAERRAHRHDRTTAGLDHLGHGVAQAEKRPFEVGVDDALPLVVGAVDD